MLDLIILFGVGYLIFKDFVTKKDD